MFSRLSTSARSVLNLHRSSQFSPSLRASGCRAWSNLTINDTSLVVHSLNASFPYIWLRDSCQSLNCIHSSTSQKLHRTSDIPIDIKPIHDGVQLAADGIHIDWADGHNSFFYTSFLERHSSPQKLAAFHKDIAKAPWDNKGISESRNLFVPYESLRTEAGLLAAITQIVQYGLLFVSGVPNKETSDDTCELPTLAQFFGDIRPTFYGRIWDVVNVRNSSNIAYTNLDLGLHMDLLYFEHPPRYQILHCLRNRVHGGTSIFVDAFRAASALRETHPSEFEVLSTTPVAYHYINDGHHLHREHRTIEVTTPTPGSSEGSIDHINYSPPFQAPLPLSTPAAFYPALQRFAKLLNDPANTYQYTLKEGDAVFFDNRRVLHARTAFSDVEGQGGDGEPSRWLKGCYLEADDMMDRGRVLTTRLEMSS
ncbi:Trimethyllysine dioxygenase, mitochondrial [Hypsizygus marmoreus]|uniref:Trimethyllysine dioxygenase, mitochondrial n=1 Tax=Hypsizygus marmoreus TaxID=39966 RepID=A0A369J544_HYPMA|nr:Trimethyllysine dioxygenase, mitochondrial [Hypsizygus marmoreus]